MSDPILNIDNAIAQVKDDINKKRVEYERHLTLHSNSVDIASLSLEFRKDLKLLKLKLNELNEMKAKSLAAPLPVEMSNASNVASRVSAARESSMPAPI